MVSSKLLSQSSTDSRNGTITLQRVFRAGMLLIILLIVGTLGYMVLEGWAFLDALWMTVITMSTVGYSEVAPMDTSGRILSIFLIISTILAGSYALGNISAFIVEGEIMGVLRGRQQVRKMEQLSKHVILVGFGAVGREAAEWWRKYNKKIVVVEMDAEMADEAQKQGFMVLVGDATREQILKQAGIERADGMMIAMQNLADSVLIALTARELNPDIIISARADDEVGEKRLRRAGADQVILPSQIGGRRLAEFLRQPTIVEFLDLVMHQDDVNLRLATVDVYKDSFLDGKTLKDSDLRNKTGGALVMSIKKADGKHIVAPSFDYRLNHGDRLITLGNDDMIENAGKLAAGEKT